MTKAELLAAVSDIRVHTNESENALGRALYRLDKLAAAIAVMPEDETPTPTPTPAPTPTPTPAPTPTPTPTPPVPPGAIAIDGVVLSPVNMGSITTPTGSWPVDDLGPVAGGHAYLLRYDGNADWGGILIPTDEDGDGTIELRTYLIASPYYTGALAVLPGAIGCVDNGEPVKPDMTRIVEAVQAGRVLAYRSTAFEGWPKSPVLAATRTDENKLGYNPARVYGRSGTNNAVAYALTGSGGEYSSSRGFISGDDALMIAAALEGNATVFADAADQGRVQVLYGLGVPNLAIWSENNHTLRDPQHPFVGDLPYTNEGLRVDGVDSYGNEGSWTAPEAIPEIGVVAGTTYSHTRDAAHLFNHGFAYWLATGDPRAAILQQAIGAYALASVYQGGHEFGYRAPFRSQRQTMNGWSAAWKMRDVADHADGPLLWEPSRGSEMAYDIIDDWETQLARMDAATDIYNRGSSIFRGIDNGLTATDSAWNAFMMAGYGPDVAYLWAMAGEPAMMTRLAENAVLRFGKIGGTRGYYGHGGGSGFRLLEGNTLPYSDEAGLIEWTNTANTYPTDTFDGAPAHYILRSYWTLRLAKAAGSTVPGIDEAIARMEAARDATTAWNNTDVIKWKHAGVPE